jgi:hypothetical protein
MLNFRLSFIVLILGIGICSCKKDVSDTQYMRTGAILNFSSHGKRTKNYVAKFYEGTVSNVSSDMAQGITPIANRLFRSQKGNDGKPENLWVPAGTITVIVINNDTKSFSFTTFEARMDSYAIVKANFNNTTECGCGKLYREKWEEPVSYTN